MSELTATDVAIEQIKKAGFSHIKVELEADLGRDGERECSDCDDGYSDCDECNGDGVLMAERPNGTEVEVECDECYGEGRVECGYCDGRGYDGGYYDEDYCETFMRDWVGSDVLSRLTYGNFYEDGSVDSEFTFTVPIEHYKDIVVWIDSFKALSEDIGNGYNTGGAGMHISLIPKESNGNYPNRHRMPDDKIENFAEQMSKLLPAMLFFSSNNEVSRGLSYRTPQVSHDEKYSAIYTHDGTCIEYRAFETCYDEPERIYEHIEVVAKTLQFYVDPTKTVETMGFRFNFSDSYSGQEGRQLSRFYDTPEKIAVLRKQLKYIKPDGKSNAELMAQRGVSGITDLRKKISKRRNQLRKQYFKSMAMIKIQEKTPLTERQMIHLEELKQYSRRYSENLDEQQMIDQAKGINRLPDLETYIKNNLGSNEGRGYTAYC